MLKNLFLILFISTSPILMAQDIERVTVKGKIHVPEGEDAEGISVYNVSAQKGTVTDADGAFEIAVAENDRLQIFALQYKTFIVVMDKGVIERKKLNIFVNPAITQLDEVVIRPYDLSGNVRADVEKIPTYYVSNDWNLDYTSMEMSFERDYSSKIEGNAAEEALNSHYLTNGLNFISILGGVAELLFPKKEKLTNREKTKKEELISNNMQHRFSQEFILDNFGIPLEKTNDFLFYAQENGLEERLLKTENEMELIDFLHQKAKEYKKRGE